MSSGVLEVERVTVDDNGEVNVVGVNAVGNERHRVRLVGVIAVGDACDGGPHLWVTYGGETHCASCGRVPT